MHYYYNVFPQLHQLIEYDRVYLLIYCARAGIRVTYERHG